MDAYISVTSWAGNIKVGMKVPLNLTSVNYIPNLKWKDYERSKIDISTSNLFTDWSLNFLLYTYFRSNII